MWRDRPKSASYSTAKFMRRPAATWPTGRVERAADALLLTKRADLNIGFIHSTFESDMTMKLFAITVLCLFAVVYNALHMDSHEGHLRRQMQVSLSMVHEVHVALYIRPTRPTNF